MKKPKFRRTDGMKYSKLGVRRKKKQIYRKSKGRDNKVRLKMKGHLRNVTPGYKNKKEERGKIRGLIPVKINNLEELKRVKENEIGVIKKIGRKKKKEIAEYSIKNKIRLANMNPEKFLERYKKETKPDNQKNEIKGDIRKRTNSDADGGKK